MRQNCHVVLSKGWGVLLFDQISALHKYGPEGPNPECAVYDFLRAGRSDGVVWMFRQLFISTLIVRYGLGGIFGLA